MSAPYEPGRDPKRVSAAEIAALTRRLRDLSAAGRDADPRERAAFLADKEELLDRIAAAAERSGDRSADELVADQPGDDDRWFADGYDAAHQAHLDHLAHVDAPDPGASEQDDADGQDFRLPAMTEEERAAALRRLAQPARPDDPAEIAARIAEIRDRVHAEALAENVRGDQFTRWHAADNGPTTTDQERTEDPGWSR